LLKFTKIMKIDFIAYHSIHAQCGQSVFDSLSKYHECRWIMGPFAIPEDGDGDVAIMLDHRAYHHLFKSRNGYKYLFHLSHDLADINMYKHDKLFDFDLIFVPTTKHQKACVQNGYKLNKIIKSGWPKYDLIERHNKFSFIESLTADRKTLIYAPTYVVNDEWRLLLKYFSDLNLNVIIKNHPLIDEGQSFPPGEEEEYKKIVSALDQMEDEARSMNFVVAPREMNIVELFIHSNAKVAVSDISSCLLEFLPFGAAIETGGGDGPGDASSFSNEVKYIPADELVKLSSDEFNSLIKKENADKKDTLLEFDIEVSYGELIANKIREYMKTTKPNIRLKDTKSYFILKTYIKSFIKKIFWFAPNFISKNFFNLINNR